MLKVGEKARLLTGSVTYVPVYNNKNIVPYSYCFRLAVPGCRQGSDKRPFRSPATITDHSAAGIYFCAANAEQPSIGSSTVRFPCPERSTGAADTVDGRINDGE